MFCPRCTLICSISFPLINVLIHSNPDCGLKTRAWPETIAALRNMVEVTKNMRAEILSA